MDDDEDNFTVVKSTLNRFCNDDFIKSHLQDYCFQTNLLLNETYLFVNLHVNRILENNLKSEYKTLNQTFFNHVFSGLKTNVKLESKRFKTPELILTYELAKEPKETQRKMSGTEVETLTVLSSAIDDALEVLNQFNDIGILLEKDYADLKTILQKEIDRYRATPQ
jgi:hypothetical protein